jgi:ubiquinone/menaquinone biosynthesis C-methylase UbiE
LLLRFGDLSDGDRVVDVGCGTGSLTFTVPQIANVNSVVRVDLTEPYVEFARARSTDPPISFQSADARVILSFSTLMSRIMTRRFRNSRCRLTMPRTGSSYEQSHNAFRRSGAEDESV